MNTIDVCIAICTYKRKEIKATLRSISEQILPGNVSVEIVIADNAETSCAQDYIQQVAEQYDLRIKYVHAPSRNISIARNACLENATSHCLIFIDDDEIASPKWLLEMIECAKSTKADVVFGPVTAVYSKTAPQWIIDCDLHSTRPVFVNGRIETGYTGNTLLNLNSPNLVGARFDINLGRTGGEDTDFLSRAYKKGALLEYAEKAEVSEKVPTERATWKWLSNRRFRVGQSYASTVINSKSPIIKRVFTLVTAAFKASFCAARSFICVFSESKRKAWLLRMWLHLGVCSKILGQKEKTHY